ncbi:MAG: hypothetical protein O3A51_07880, partial [Verrucomicrobia bacterium]|nr:hypothetical protein [Verrucomicrobiota bacterium]
VHMLSSAAFNALLKTLEEPPSYVKFIFATTEPQKVLATVISRCQRFDLRRIPVPLLVERLALIAESENIAIEDDALLAIARGAEGGLRDAESALDQLISFRGADLKEADVLSVFGLISRARLETLADAILRGDVRSLIMEIGELDAAGKDLQRVVVELMEHFRNLLVCINVDDPTALPDMTEAQRTVLAAQAAATDTARVLRIVTLLAETEDRMKFALSRRTLLETALIRCARAATVVSLEEILSKIQALRSGQDLPASPPAETATATRRPMAYEATRDARPTPRAATARPQVAKAAKMPELDEEALRADLRELVSDWPAIIARVAKKAVLAKSVLIDARPVAVKSACVVIGFDSEFPEEMERFQRGRDRKALEMTLSQALGRTVAAAFELVEGGLDAPTDDSEGGEGRHPLPTMGASATSRDWSMEDAVRKTLDMFNGSIVDIRE